MRTLLYFCFVILFSRAEASASLLAELNPYVTIQTSTTPIGSGNLDFLKHYQVQATLYIAVIIIPG